MLDASVVIAQLKREPGQEHAEAFLLRGAILTVKLAEVFQCLRNQGSDRESASLILEAMEPEMVSCDAEIPRDAGHLGVEMALARPA